MTRSQRQKFNPLVRIDTVNGGDVEAGSRVDENWLLTVERKEFMALLHTEKTQQRIAQIEDLADLAGGDPGDPRRDCQG